MKERESQMPCGGIVGGFGKGADVEAYCIFGGLEFNRR